MVEQQNNIKLSHENVTPRAVLAHILLSYLIQCFLLFASNTSLLCQGWFPEEPPLLWDCLHCPRCPHTGQRALMSSLLFSISEVAQPAGPAY